ncbi:MAG: DUF2189 domain-containing protein [Sutterellaceae bacterium]|nr:DUF2189 domain-containing protein [Burkholderiaceae bacterium]MDW8429434.1 DUF2189 domain-containing protein [Sutterellaceae bacterium]
MPPLPTRTIALPRPFAWLRRGWADLCSVPGASMLHGVLVFIAGWVILALARNSWPLMASALSGFVLVAPILATGLYELSRRREQGRQPRLADAVRAWQRGTRPLVALGLLLFAAATAWVVASTLLLGPLARGTLTQPLDFLRYAVDGQGWLLFSLWLLAGGLGAALVFAATAVSAPLLLDRAVDLRTAVLTSVRAVGDNPLPMALWAAVIMLATLASLATALAGFVLTVPVIGHATWHAYRDLVDAKALPTRVD